MKKTTLLLAFASAILTLDAQVSPSISAWMQNTTNLMGKHYLTGSSNVINDNVLANVQSVKYSTTSVYVATNGIPAYATGPFQDRNPSLATAQNAIFKLPLIPTEKTGTKTATTGGNIGIFINGVALFDYRDGVMWNTTSSALCGGPGNSMCPGGPSYSSPWNRDAVPSEKKGFDCAKAHPANGNYHHHQNPSAFNLDKLVASAICDSFPSDGLYVIDSTKHSPLIGFAYDGFAIYGAYGYKNANETGGVTRIKSSYNLSSNTTRASGPAVNTTYFNGYFREDYVFTAPTAATPDYLDVHNGRFCITPEYPNGIYCYFATVDANWNSAYPYVVGPTFYGVVTGAKVTSITETVTTFIPSTTTGINDANLKDVNISVFPNPGSDYLAVQAGQITKENIRIGLFDLAGKKLMETTLIQGSTIAYFDTRTLYDGIYLVQVGNTTKRVVIQH